MKPQGRGLSPKRVGDIFFRGERDGVVIIDFRKARESARELAGEEQEKTTADPDGLPAIDMCERGSEEFQSAGKVRGVIQAATDNLLGWAVWAGRADGRAGPFQGRHGRLLLFPPNRLIPNQRAC